MTTPLVKVSTFDFGVTPARKALEKPPTKALKPVPSVKAMLYPYTTQMMHTRQTQENTCISIDSMFLVRTMPP